MDRAVKFRMQTPMRHVAARLAYKRTQLHSMMAYCESADCRQQALDHFGNPEPLLATSCCDHCERSRVRRSAAAPSVRIGARQGRVAQPSATRQPAIGAW